KRYTGQPLRSTRVPNGVSGHRSSSSKTPSLSPSILKTPSAQISRENAFIDPPSDGDMSRTSRIQSPKVDSPLKAPSDPNGFTVPLMAGKVPQIKLSASSSKVALMFRFPPQELETRTALVPEGEISVISRSERKEWIMSTFTFTSPIGRSFNRNILEVRVEVPMLDMFKGRS